MERDENNRTLDESSDVNYKGILDDKYYIIKTLGTGYTSKVKLAKDINSGDLFAIKFLQSNQAPKDLLDKAWKSEASNLKTLKHNNIIELIHAENSGQYHKANGRTKHVQYLVLELIPNGELFEYIYFPRKGLGEYFARAIFLQILDAVDHSHKNGLAHRDLKTDNMMLGANYEVKIADFGFSTLLKGVRGDNVLHTLYGTPNYCAPELLRGKPYNGVCADIFSCGVILFILVTGKIPFNKAIAYDPRYRYFLKNDYDAYWTNFKHITGNISNELKFLLNFMLNSDPVQRPSMKRLNPVNGLSWKIYLVKKKLRQCLIKENLLLFN